MDFKNMPSSVDVITRDGQWFVKVTTKGNTTELGPFDMSTAQRIASEQLQPLGHPKLHD